MLRFEPIPARKSPGTNPSNRAIICHDFHPNPTFIADSVWTLNDIQKLLNRIRALLTSYTINMSAFRPIRPSTDTKDEPLSGESSLQGALDSHGPLGKGRKRRVPSHVSQNACTNCKKARAKVRLRLITASPAAYNGLNSVMARSPLLAHAASVAIKQTSVSTKFTSRPPRKSLSGR